jgi:hypothetical protein
MVEMMLVDSITSNARQDPGRGALQVMNHASGLERSHFTAGCQILIRTSPDGDMSERLRLDTSPAAENLRFQLIVGLNVATKGAPPFSRGKQVIPGKQDVPHRSRKL